MYNDCGCSGGCGSSAGRNVRVLRVGALSLGEWNYLRGLYLADGYKYVNKRSGAYSVRFFLQWNEGGIARRVVGLIVRAGLSPHILKPRRGRMITVIVYSKALFTFLPEKRALADDASVREQSFEECSLRTVLGGVPFLAGLLDGDGHVGVNAVIRRALVGILQQWSFKQTTLPFLVDYVVEFVNSISPGGAGLAACGGGKRLALIHNSGRDALLGAGIADYSWKAAQWVAKLANLRKKVKKYYTVRQAAELLGVSTYVVKGWAADGRLRMERIGRNAKRWCYIPVEDLERFRGELLKERESVDKVMGRGMKLAEAARVLGVSGKTLSRMHRRGKLQATLVCVGRQKYLVIPREEVERLKRELMEDGGG